ncbi:MAG: hypothetical protein ACTSV5_09295 [Promethearchaeota archaeon]
MNHDYSPFPLTTSTDNLSKFIVRVGADLKYEYDLVTNEERLAEVVEYLESWQIVTRKMIAHPGIIILGS